MPGLAIGLKPIDSGGKASVQAGTNGGAADILFTPSATSNGAQLFCSRQGLLATMRQDYSAVSLAQEQKLMTFREYRLKKLEHGLRGREPRYLIVKFVRVQGQGGGGGARAVAPHPPLP